MLFKVLPFLCACTSSFTHIYTGINISVCIHTHILKMVSLQEISTRNSCILGKMKSVKSFKETQAPIISQFLHLHHRFQIPFKVDPVWYLKYMDAFRHLL